MPALGVLLTILATAGATAAAEYLLGPDPSERQVECVKQVLEALQPRTVGEIEAIVRQCKARYAE